MNGAARTEDAMQAPRLDEERSIDELRTHNTQHKAPGAQASRHLGTDDSKAQAQTGRQIQGLRQLRDD